MKKFFITMLTIVSALVLVACDDGQTEDNTNKDVTAPLFLDLVQGKLATIEHLEGEEVDLMEGVRVRDDVDEVEDIVVKIDDMDGYDKDVFGTYTLVYSATDTSNNTSTVERVVIVQETLTTTFEHALLSNGNVIQAVYNDPEALKVVGSNAKFRNRSDLINVLDKEEYLSQVAEYYPDSHPGFAWGNVAIVNEEGRLVHMRFAQGAQFELNGDDEILYAEEDLPWFASHGGGDLLLGIEELIPDGGKVLLAGSPTGVYGDLARIFLIQSLIWTEYQGGGGVTKDVIDVPADDRYVELVNDYEIKIKMPERIDTPTIEINRHVLSWDAIEGAKGYDLYINGTKDNESLLTGTSINLLDYFNEDEVGTAYEIEVKALSANVLLNANSEFSNKLDYEKIEILRMDTPVVENNEGIIEWDPVTGADTYKVFLDIAGKKFEVAEVEENEFDVNTLDKKAFGGVNMFYIQGIGTDDYSDSDISNKVASRVDYHEKVMTVGGMKTTVVVMTAENYFVRRNGTDATRPENYLHLIEGVKEYMEAGNTVNEAFSSLALLDSNNKVSFVRNILAKQTYFKEDGWFEDEEYTNNGVQLVGLDKYIEEDDKLLIGKNGLKVTYTIDTETKEMDSRDFLAYHFIKSWEIGGTEGWRDPMNTFVDAKEVEFTLE